jgi:hypothetical protein
MVFPTFNQQSVLPRQTRESIHVHQNCLDNRVGEVHGDASTETASHENHSSNRRRRVQIKRKEQSSPYNANYHADSHEWYLHEDRIWLH